MNKSLTMLDHMILTVSDVERSLAFYEAALKPLNIKFFMPYKREDGQILICGDLVMAKGVLLDKARGAQSSGYSLGVRGSK